MLDLDLAYEWSTWFVDLFMYFLNAVIIYIVKLGRKSGKR